ncbi:MAG: PQQ-binding-like beta-propeller repeat protein [Phycisphaeraceae bacterium]|nr:PQQ-binding-like beta-propeller repeat protein [Phycisphaeraceae bacterium]
MRPRALSVMVCLWGGITVSAPVQAQPEPVNPVYLDEAPLAEEALARVPELVAANNYPEAVRVLQRALDESADRLLPSPDTPDLFVTVRSRVRETLLRSPELLARYREMQDPIAWRLLTEQGPSEVESTRALTSAGFEAVLRVAQIELESGRFESARLTLERLEGHPDLQGDNALAAAELMRCVAGYLDRAEIWEIARQWGGLADSAPTLRPPSQSLAPSSPLTVAAPTDLQDVVSKPLFSMAMLDPQVDGPWLMNLTPWIMPTVVGDTLYINDGQSIGAWDRFTLQLLWRTPLSNEFTLPSTQRRRQPTPIVVDSNTVTVQGDVVLATGGRVIAQGRGGLVMREGDSRLIALDRATGRVLWSWHPQVGDLEARTAMVWGPLLIDEGLALATVRRQVPIRRSWSTGITALDISSGEVVWSRTLASAGSLPYQTQTSLINAAGVLDRGVVYRADEVGVIAAVEAASGRIRWIRRHPTLTYSSYDPAPAHASSAPIVDGDTLITLSPDRAEVLRIDARSGRVVGSREARMLGSPRYLLREGENLIAVSDVQIVVTPLDQFEQGPVGIARIPSGRPILARVVVAGDRLLVPVESGIVVVDPNTSSVERRLDLDESGNLLPLEGQVLVAGRTTMHSYLVWSVAEAELARRMAEDPGNPAPALTYIELGYRAGRVERLLEVIDHAQRAIDGLSADESRASRDRLFAALDGMARDAIDAPSGPARVVVADAMLDGVIQRLGRVAATPDQRVAHLMARARVREREGDIDGAITDCQSVLEDSALAAANWSGRRVMLRAEVEATRRVRDLLDRHGAEAYRAFETLARSELDALPLTAAADAFERVARRFPASSVAPVAWLGAARAHRAVGETHAELRARRAGLAALEVQDVHSSDVRAELAGGLIAALVEQQRYAEAARALARVSGLLIDGEVELDRGRVIAQVHEAVAAREVLPKLGPRIEPEFTRLDDWVLIETMSVEPIWRSPGYVVLQRASAERPGQMELALLDARGAPEGAMRWTREAPGSVRIVRSDPDALLAVSTDAGDLTLYSIAADTGQTRWTVAGSTLLQNDLPLNLADEAFESPLDGPVRASDVMLLTDERTLAMVERSGRAALIDLATGEPLWTRAEAGLRVLDADLDAGLLVLAIEPRQGPAAASLLAIDSRSGDHVLEVTSPVLTSRPRWVRITPRSELLVGLDSGVIEIDPADAQVRWLQDHAAAKGTLAAWPIAGALFIMSGDRKLWRISMTDGSIDETPIDTADTLRTSFRIRSIEVDQSLALSSGRGLIVVGASGQVTGADSIHPPQDTLIPAICVDDAFVTLDTRAARGSGAFRLYMMDRTGRQLREPVRLLLDFGVVPTSMAMLDNVVLVSTSSATLVLRAP